MGRDMETFMRAFWEKSIKLVNFRRDIFKLYYIKQFQTYASVHALKFSTLEMSQLSLSIRFTDKATENIYGIFNTS